jgi:opacity protein-like surface antigen
MMKKLFAVCLLIFGAQIITPAQIKNTAFTKGSWELNFTGSIGSVKYTESVTSSYYNNGGSDSESRNYFQLGIIPALYMVKGVSIEPEINILTLESQKPAFLILGNISYTLKLGSSHFFPYVRAGYGVTNSFQVPVTGDLSRFSDRMNIPVLNVGAGLKTMLVENVLLRTEINYRKYSYAEDNAYYNYQLDVSSVSMIFGFSFLL